MISSRRSILVILAASPLLAVGFPTVLPLHGKTFGPRVPRGTTVASAVGRRFLVATRSDELVTTQADDELERAVADFRMITEGEALFRMAGGVFFGAAAAAAFALRGDYALLSAGAFLSLAMYRTGAASQCGCIVHGAWSLGGPFSFDRIPAFRGRDGFVAAKTRQLLGNVATSAAFGVAVADAAALAKGDASLEVWRDTALATIPVLLLGAAATVATRWLRKD